MNNYHHSLVGTRSRAAGDGPAAAEGLALPAIRDHLLMAREPDASLSKVALVGGTLALGWAGDLADPEYQHGVNRLFSKCSFALMRDPISTAHAELMRQGSHDACLGFDCAFLLPATGIAAAHATEAHAPYVGVFLGRNGENSASTRLANALVTATRLDAVTIPWLPHKVPKAPRFLRRIRRIADRVGRRLGLAQDPVGPKQPPVTFEGLLAEVANAEFVITDTYHLAVNAWNMGVPTVMIADTSEDRAFSVNSGTRWAWRDKRLELYSMIDALPLFVRTEELREPGALDRRVEQLVATLRDPGDPTLPAVRRRVHDLRERFDTELTRRVTTHLGIGEPRRRRSTDLAKGGRLGAGAVTGLRHAAGGHSRQ